MARIYRRMSLERNGEVNGGSRAAGGRCCAASSAGETEQAGSCGIPAEMVCEWSGKITPERMTLYFTKVRRQQSILKFWGKKALRILYASRISFKNEGEIKTNEN